MLTETCAYMGVYMGAYMGVYMGVYMGAYMGEYMGAYMGAYMCACRCTYMHTNACAYMCASMFTMCLHVLESTSTCVAESDDTLLWKEGQDLEGSLGWTMTTKAKYTAMRGCVHQWTGYRFGARFCMGSAMDAAARKRLSSCKAVAR